MMLASIAEHEHYRQKSIIIYCLPHSVGADIKHQKMKTLVLNTLGNDYTEQIKTLIMPMLNMTVGFRGGWMRHEMRYHPLNIGLLYKGNADQTMMEDWCKRTAVNIGGHSLGASLYFLTWSSSTAAHVWQSSAIRTRLSTRSSKGWKELASHGNSTISPTVRNGMQHVKPSLPTNVSGDFLGVARQYAFSEDYRVARSALWGLTKASNFVTSINVTYEPTGFRFS